MLGSLFAKVLEMSAGASGVILMVVAARFLLRRAPAAFSSALWLVVLFRLLCPAGIGIPVEIDSVVRASEGIVLSGAAVEDGTRTFGAAYIWAGGAMVLLVWNALVYLRLRRRLVGAALWKDNIYLADHIDMSFVLGGLRPGIYLPSTLGEKEREYIVEHERQHIRRLDHVVKPLFVLALCVHWFNPLVWLAFILMERDMEMSCDEAVLNKLGGGIRAEYAACLLNTSAGRRNIMEMPLAFGGGDTKGRLKNMKKWKKPGKWVIVIGALFCAVVMLGCVVVPVTDGAAKREDESVCTANGCMDPTHGHEADRTDLETVYYTASEADDCSDQKAVYFITCTDANHHSGHDHDGHH